MDKTLIITSHVEKIEYVNLDYHQFTHIICADGGLLIAETLGLSPTHLIGDYDSMTMPKNLDVIKLPTEKDMTDTEAAVDLAIQNGANHITVLGGLGGRLDHTMGNLGIMAKYCGRINHMAFVDGQNYTFLLSPGTIQIPKNAYKYLGIISYGDSVKNLTLRGVKYPLTDYVLTHDTSLGVSNEIISDAAEISFTQGKLLIILSKDIDK